MALRSSTLHLSGAPTWPPYHGLSLLPCLRAVGSYTARVSCQRSRSIVHPSATFRRLRRPPPGHGVLAPTLYASGKPGSVSPLGNGHLPLNPIPPSSGYNVIMGLLLPLSTMMKAAEPLDYRCVLGHGLA